MLWVVDELMTLKASAEHNGGAYSLTDSVVPSGGGPPPHVHHREHEAFWVLEGELEVQVGEKHLHGECRLLRTLPKGVPHAYQNIGTGPARFLTLMVPGGLETFFEEVGKLGTELSSPRRLKKTSTNS